MDVFLYDRSHRHKRVKNLELLGRLSSGFLKENCWLYQWVLPRVFRLHEHNIGVFRTLSNIYERFFPKHSYHRVKSAHIQSYSAPYFPAFGLNTGKYGPKYLRMWTPIMRTPPLFLRRGGEVLTGPRLLEGSCWERGGGDFFRAGLQFSQEKN